MLYTASYIIVTYVILLEHPIEISQLLICISDIHILIVEHSVLSSRNSGSVQSQYFEKLPLAQDINAEYQNTRMKNRILTISNENISPYSAKRSAFDASRFYNNETEAWNNCWSNNGKHVFIPIDAFELEQAENSWKSALPICGARNFW